jgi:hypothetical protein
MLKNSRPYFPPHKTLQAIRRTLIARYLRGFNSLRIDNSSSGVKREGDFGRHMGGGCSLLGGLLGNAKFIIHMPVLFVRLRLGMPSDHAPFQFSD